MVHFLLIKTKRKLIISLRVNRNNRRRIFPLRVAIKSEIGMIELWNNSTFILWLNSKEEKGEKKSGFFMSFDKKSRPSKMIDCYKKEKDSAWRRRRHAGFL